MRFLVLLAVLPVLSFLRVRYYSRNRTRATAPEVGSGLLGYSGLDNGDTAATEETQ